MESGGLWNGHYYEQIWKDGTRNRRILQDQTIGILVGVVSSEEALEIIRGTARSELSARNDWIPHEYVQAGTGANEGKPIQAWNASLFGALFFGLKDAPARVP